MPRPLPIMLIHGFDGRPEGWDLSGFVAALIEAGLDPDLIWRFHFGWGANGYDGQADIRHLAARLMHAPATGAEAHHSQLARLSEASLARGGPPGVTIVAHSMGGLIARYYLARRVPDEWGTVNEGLVRRLVTIATPHLGLPLAAVTHLAPPDAPIWKLLDWIENLPFTPAGATADLKRLESQIAGAQRAAWAGLRSEGGAKGYGDSPAVRQMAPNSPLLEELSRRGAFPDDVALAVAYGDIQIAIRVTWRGVVLWKNRSRLGDLVVPADSASTVPHAAPVRLPFSWDRELSIRVDAPALQPLDLTDVMPAASHSNLLLSSAVHQAVIRQITGR